MIFSVALRPYEKPVGSEIYRVLLMSCPGRALPLERCPALSTALIVIGLLPVITFPVFHIWILFSAMPVLLLCLVSLIYGFVLRYRRTHGQVPAEYLAAVPEEQDQRLYVFDENGVTLQGIDGTPILRKPFTEVVRVFETDHSYVLSFQDNTLAVLPKKDFEIGIHPEFRTWIKQKTGKPVECVT